MAFLDVVKEVFVNQPVHLKSPYFMKADSNLKEQLEKLKEFRPLCQPKHLKSILRKCLFIRT